MVRRLAEVTTLITLPFAFQTFASKTLPLGLFNFKLALNMHRFALNVRV
jgi:hypothetical protein